MKKLVVAMKRAIVLLLVMLVGLWLFVARPTPLFKGQQHNSPVVNVDADELERHVRYLSQEYSPRVHWKPDNLNRVADFISQNLRSSGGVVSLQTFDVDGVEYKNVVAEYGPEGAPLYIVGAHYDSVGTLPGADDNASGVAGLLQLGRLLSQNPPNVRVMLVAFSLEEPPHFGRETMGSAVFARSLSERSVSIELMISLEMIGYFSEELNSQLYPSRLLQLFYPSVGNFIGIVDQSLSLQAQHMKKSMREAIELPVYSMNVPRLVTAAGFSDHRNFWAYGYPAVMVTDTAFFRNKNYHTAQDTADTLDYEKMALVVVGVYHFLREAN